MRVLIAGCAIILASHAAVADTREQERVCNNGVFVPSQNRVTPFSDTNRGPSSLSAPAPAPYAQLRNSPNANFGGRGGPGVGGDYDPCAAVNSTSRTYDKGR
jgi:hypothetical protein